MQIRLMVLLSLLVATPITTAFAQSNEDACRPDVRRFCSKIRRGASDDDYLACLQAHRSRLSASCRRVLERNGK